jgi:hypothetical protein
MENNTLSTELQVTEMGKNSLFINSKDFTTASLILSIPEPFASLHKLRSSFEGDYDKIGNTFTFKAKDIYQIRINEGCITLNSDKFFINLWLDGSTLSLIF